MLKLIYMKEHLYRARYIVGGVIDYALIVLKNMVVKL